MLDNGGNFCWNSSFSIISGRWPPLWNSNTNAQSISGHSVGWPVATDPVLWPRPERVLLRPTPELLRGYHLLLPGAKPSPLVLLCASHRWPLQFECIDSVRMKIHTFIVARNGKGKSGVWLEHHVKLKITTQNGREMSRASPEWLQCYGELWL